MFDAVTYNRKYRRKLKKRGICPQCGKKAQKGRWLCRKCTVKSKLQTLDWMKTPKGKAYRRKWNQERLRRLRETVIQHYGGKCVCCGESDLRFLTIDHSNGDGATDPRNKLKTGRKTSSLEWYKQIIKLGFPKDLQPLCWNCNQGKHMYGDNKVCPHKLPPGVYLGKFLQARQV